MVVVALWSGCTDEDRPGSTGVDPGEPVELVERGVQECATPGTRSSAGPFERRFSLVPAPYDPWIWHGGITAADLNGDDLLDVVVALEQGLELYEGTTDLSFPTRGQAVFGAFDLSFASGATVADYDADGDLDLYVMRVAGDPAPEWSETNGYGKNRLLQNQGDGTFVDVTDAAGGVDGCGVHQRTGDYGCWKSMTSSWGDIDGDQDLDLYVGNYGYVDETDGTTQEEMESAEPDFLYLNNGDGTFTDASNRLPIELREGYTYAGGWFDLDDDGDLDLYTVNDFGNFWPNRVLWNNGTGQFGFQSTDPSGLDQSMTGMGLGVGDLNGDGRPDLVMPVWQHVLVYESRTSGVWIDVSQNVGIYEPAEEQHVPWGTELGDLDNDGDLDVITQFGFVKNDNSEWSNGRAQPDALYLNDSTWSDDGVSYTLTDVAAAWGVADTGMSRGAVLADLNRDGWLDLGKRILNNHLSILESENAVYLSNCGSEGWLEVALAQPGTPNTFAVGAKVTIEAGGRQYTRTLHAGGTGYASQPPPELHFGLGDASRIDLLTVRWPDGAVSRLEDIDTRQRIAISR
ncbi:MAG: CRTAC1 family protein [Myxococcota bacterium]